MQLSIDQQLLSPSSPSPPSPLLRRASQLSVAFLYFYGNHNPHSLTPHFSPHPLLPLQVGFAEKLLTDWSSSNFPHITAEERELGGGAVGWDQLFESHRDQRNTREWCAHTKKATRMQWVTVVWSRGHPSLGGWVRCAVLPGDVHERWAKC